jgi:serine acetyltransferase
VLLHHINTQNQRKSQNLTEPPVENQWVGEVDAYGSQKSPQIGDNVYIGPGAVLYGDITIADNCFIGANAVVNKSVTEEYSVIAGVPAKVIRKDTKNWLDYNSLVY